MSARFLLCLGLVLASCISAPSAAAEDSCPNSAFRTGSSATLPDCRAYELVTPADTGGVRPTAANFNEILGAFAAPLVSPSSAHDSVMFQTVGGALSGSDGTGNTDRYEAIRGNDGWTSRLIGPTAAQTEQPVPGGITPDHGFYFLTLGTSSAPDYGTLNIGESAGRGPVYLHRSDGAFELVGRGSLGESPFVEPNYISSEATHIIFHSGTLAGSPAVQLEPQAPPDGTAAIYDRSLNGPTHVVSLLPGDITPSTESFFKGASSNGRVVLFANDGILYARVDNSVTRPVAAGAWTPAGVSLTGKRVFYEEGGNLFTFDTESLATTQITTSGDAQFVNISADGSHIYFVSPSQLDGSKGVLGASNLYLWDDRDEEDRFVATVAEADVAGGINLVRWSSDAATPGMNSTHGPANDPSRTNPDGSVFVFQSRAQLTPYENAGRVEIYRYDAEGESLTCVSCNPTVKPATADASLQSVWSGSQDPVTPLPPVYPVMSVTDDGASIFFQSAESLLKSDGNTVQDIYGWKAGDLRLISSGTSRLNNYLYSVSEDGNDVLFLTNDHLLAFDRSGAGAIYDARVGGGFPVTGAGVAPCVEDACQGEPSTVSPSPSVASESLVGSRSHGRTRRCRKGSVRKHGKCHVRKHRERKHG
jgi:Tol biopolymer transport system component